jgi:uncharacterized protein (TIGR02391 family)
MEARRCMVPSGSTLAGVEGLPIKRGGGQQPARCLWQPCLMTKLPLIPEGALRSISEDIASSYAHSRLTDLGRNFESRRIASSNNTALAFVGVLVDEEGQLRAAPTARTLTEAERRADKLRSELTRRNVHSDVLRFCTAELLAEDYLHATFEAAKSIGDKIRALTGLTLDGSTLVDHAFALPGAGPFLVVNGLADDTERSEHIGLANLIRGLFGVFRNVPAHRPRIHSAVSEQEALDLFTLGPICTGA